MARPNRRFAGVAVIGIDPRRQVRVARCGRERPPLSNAKWWQVLGFRLRHPAQFILSADSVRGLRVVETRIRNCPTNCDDFGVDHLDQRGPNLADVRYIADGPNRIDSSPSVFRWEPSIDCLPRSYASSRLFSLVSGRFGGVRRVLRRGSLISH
jgi:hypothetical protein